MAFSKSSKVMVIAIIVAIMLHTFSVVATAMVHNTKPNAKLGRILIYPYMPPVQGYTWAGRPPNQHYTPTYTASTTPSPTQSYTRAGGYYPPNQWAKEVWLLWEDFRGVSLIPSERCFTEWFWKFFDSAGIELVEEVVMLFWSIWLRRNAFLHEGKRATNQKTLEQALNLLDDFHEANKKGLDRTPVMSQAAYVHWSPPVQHWVKINVDGAVFSDHGSIGVGVVIRDWKGQVMISAAEHFIMEPSPEIAELVAIIRGLQLAKDTGFSFVQLEGDAKVILDAVQDPIESFSPFGHLISDAKLLAQQFTEVSFSFVRREGNRVAHCLATLAKTCNGSCIWMEDAPRICYNDLISDCNHVSE